MKTAHLNFVFTISTIEAETQAQALMLMGEDHRRFYEAFKRRKSRSSQEDREDIRRVLEV